jgi:uncharacterized paraquat-inducible protein A
MTVLRSLLFALVFSSASASTLSAPFLPSVGASRQLAILQCCGCVEYLDADTRCDKYHCPDCPVPHQSRVTG